MKVNNITLKGYGSFLEETTVHIPEGITGIVGVYDDNERKSNGCVSGDSIININRCTLGRKYRIDQAYKGFNQIRKTPLTKVWDRSKPTYVRSFTGERVQLHEIEAIVYSGKKELWKIILENNHTLKATADHLIMTKEGWVELLNLQINQSEVMCDTLKPWKKEKKEEKNKDKEIWSLRYHPYAKKKSRDKRWGKDVIYYRLPIHRLIYEAYINNMSYDKFLFIIKNCKEESQVLKYIDPELYDIHHKDLNHYNNDIHNLECIDRMLHQKIHSERGKYNFNQGIPQYSKVCDITYIGIEDTYDIICKAPHHNFVANGIIVHNSGKSTLVSVINYILFGKGEFDKLENLVCDNSPDGEMFAKIDFDLNANSYFAERGITKGSSYLEFKENDVRRKQEDGSSTKKSSIGDITEDIIKVFGMDYDMFTASVFFEQGGMDKFINADPAVVRQYIDKVLGLEIWRASAKDITKRLKQLKDLLSTNIEYLNGLRNSLSQLDQQLLQKPVIENNLRIQQNLLKEKEEKQKAIDNSHVLLKQRAVLLSNNNIVENSIVTADIKLSETQTKRDSCVIELKEKREWLNSKELDRLNSIDDVLEQTELEKNNLKTTIEDLTNRTINISSLISSAQTTITMNKKLRDKFKSGVCSECEQTVSTDYVSDKHKQYDDIILAATKLLSDYKKEQSEITTQHNQIRPKLDSLEFDLKTLRQDKTALISEKHAIELAITNLEQEQIGYDNLIKQTEESKQKLLNQKVSLKLQILDIDKQIPADVTGNAEALQQVISDIKEKINSLIRDLGGLDQIGLSKKNVIVNITEWENKIKEAEEEIDTHNVLVEAFRDIPKQIFDKSVIAIQETANSIIQPVIPELSVHIYEDDSKLKRLIIAFEVNDKERRYKRLSGGQKTVANIGIRLGFSQVIKRRANTNIELIVLDEPFGALDEENRDLVKTVLAVVQEWFKQIIVISHVGGVETFPNVITVRYSPERGSYIQ